jgi:SAM-dependent methyltransferase
MSPAEGWRNFDASPTLRFERLPLVGRMYTKNATRFPDCVEYGDIVKGLPVPDESCDAVYCSHILEHLAPDDLRAALRNSRAILKPGGVFRFVLPDLEILARRYLDNEEADACSHFMVQAHLGEQTRVRGISGLAKLWLGNSRHLWMWDFKGMRKELEQAGFRDVRRARFGDSTDPAFGHAESENMWCDCLGIECRK